MVLAVLEVWGAPVAVVLDVVLEELPEWRTCSTFCLIFSMIADD
jgi:hypothetical protein